MVSVSVLVPVLNEAGAIGQTLEAVLAQKQVQVEVLVADGRSVDETATIVAGRQSVDQRVRLLDNPRTSIPSGLNLGLDHCRAPFVARVDGHSEISPDYLWRGVAWLLREPSLAGVGGHRIGVAKTPVGRAVALVQSSRFGVGNSIYHYADRAQLTDHATFGVYRASAVREVGGWDENLLVNEDVDFDHRLIRAGYSIGYDPAMVVRWQVRETLLGLFQQYRRYGRGKAEMVRKNGASAVRARHLAPPLAVLMGVAVVLAALFHPLTLVTLLPYLALVVAASGLTWRKRPAGQPTAWWALPLAFMATHTAWGLGFLEGLLLRRRPALASGNAQARSAGAGLLEPAQGHLATPDVGPSGHHAGRQRQMELGVGGVTPDLLGQRADHPAGREQKSHHRAADRRVVPLDVTGERRAADPQHLR